MIVPDSVLYGIRPGTVLAWTERDFPDYASRWKFDNNR
jgi:hypothetical protein